MKDGTTDGRVVNGYELLRGKWLPGGFHLPFTWLSLCYQVEVLGAYKTTLRSQLAGAFSFTPHVLSFTIHLLLVYSHLLFIYYPFTIRLLSMHYAIYYPFTTRPEQRGVSSPKKMAPNGSHF